MRVRIWLPIVFSLSLVAQTPAPKDLRLFFQENCVRCHGIDGSARDEAGKSLKGRDLTDPAWASRTRDEGMVKTILNGKFFGLAMPAFKKRLSPQEAQTLVTDVIRKAEKGRAIVPDKKP